MFKDSLIVLELSDSGIETAVQTWISVEDNPLFHNYMVQEAIYLMNISEEEEVEEKSEAQLFELSDKSVIGKITNDISEY